MNKVYTLPISTQAVDLFFEESVDTSKENVSIKNIKDPFIFLFVLFQEYTGLNMLKNRLNLTHIALQRAVEVINDLDVHLPKESVESVNLIKQKFLGLLEKNEPVSFDANTFNSLLPRLRQEALFWSDQGFSEMFNNVFDYELTMSHKDLEQLKIELAKVAHQDPQANYEAILKIKRATDLEIDTNIYFRPQHNGKNDPASLLLGYIGASKFKALEPLSPTERALVKRVFDRRFTKSGLLQETDTESLRKHFKSSVRSINALKSKIDTKVKNHLKQPLFTQDTQNNLTFPHTFTCMHSSLKTKQRLQQQF